MSNETMVTKLTLSTGKIVLIKEATVDDMEQSTQIAGKKAGENAAHLGMLIQKEMMKKIIVKINDKVLGMAEKENINSLLNLREYTQLGKFITEEMGGDLGNFQSELVTFGGK